MDLAWRYNPKKDCWELSRDGKHVASTIATGRGWVAHFHSEYHQHSEENHQDFGSAALVLESMAKREYLPKRPKRKKSQQEEASR